MRKFLLMSSVLVAGGLLSGGAAEAACIQTPTCSSLGYTSTSSCTGGVKCPFGNAWNCTGPNNTTEINNLKTEITNIKKKITELEEGCCSGLGSDSGKCQIGSIFYSDKTCSSSLELNKTPIGVVVYLDSTGHGQAISLKAVNSPFFDTWFSEYGLIDGVWYGSGDCYVDYFSEVSLSEMYKDTLDKAIQDFDSCGNTQKLLSAGDNMVGAKKTNEFSTEGTTAGDWCMPAAGVLNNIIKNKLIIDNAMKLAGGLALSTAISSTMMGDSSYWLFYRGNIKNEYLFYHSTDVGEYSCPSYSTIRPVLTF